MSMKVWVITESYLDYKGADATTHGIYKTKEDALKAFRDVLLDIFDLTNRCEYGDAEIDEWIKARFVYDEGTSMMWASDDDDCSYKFYIEEMNADI